MTKSPTIPLKASEKHPINLALGFLPRNKTDERKVYQRLINTWNTLPTEEHRKFVVGVMAARGDYEAAMYAQGLAKIQDPLNLTVRRARMLDADVGVHR